MPVGACCEETEYAEYDEEAEYDEYDEDAEYDEEAEYGEEAEYDEDGFNQLGYDALGYYRDDNSSEWEAVGYFDDCGMFHYYEDEAVVFAAPNEAVRRFLESMVTALPTPPL